MKNLSINTVTPSWDDKLFLDDSLLNINVPSILDNMKNYYLASDEDLNSRILLKSDAKSIVLTIVHKGTVINSFQSADSVTFQVLEGRLMLNTKKDSVIMNKGQKLTLNEKIKYRLITTEDSAFLLTIANLTQLS